ncbi:MAG: hypothetical protein K6E36_00995 [Oscillospiraceae bacterium]|nr:hypothetical protein [Oscillospiraceae bacterium]
MQVCPHCGKEIQSGNFCTACGSALPAGTANESKLLKKVGANEKVIQRAEKLFKICGIAWALVILFRFVFPLHFFIFLLFGNKFIFYFLFLGLPILAFLYWRYADKARKSELLVYTDRILFCGITTNGQQMELRYSQITSVELAPVLYYKDAGIRVKAGGFPHLIPVNDTTEMCQLIQKMMKAN